VAEPAPPTARWTTRGSPPSCRPARPGTCWARRRQARRPLRPPSWASGACRHPCQASSPVGHRSCRRGSDGKSSRLPLLLVRRSITFVPLLGNCWLYFRAECRRRLRAIMHPSTTRPAPSVLTVQVSQRAGSTWRRRLQRQGVVGGLRAWQR
jgi:hypothetical protein